MYMVLETASLIALAAVICWGFGDYFIQQTVRKIGSVQSLFFIGLIGSILMLPLVWTELPLAFQPENALFLIGIGVLTFIVALILFESLKEGKLSVVDVIFEFELPITVLLALFFFGEQLTLIQGFLIGLIFVGILLIALEHLHIKKIVHSLEKGVLLALIGSVGMGFLNFYTASASRTITPGLAIFVPWVIYGTLSLAVIMMRKETHSLWSNFRKYPHIILGQSILDSLAWMFFAVALSQHSAAIVTAITESYPALALFLGVWFNKEKIASHQMIGAAVALGACVILAFYAG